MIDPDTMRVSRHAIERYRSRRGAHQSDEETADTIRGLLARVAHRNPPLRIADGRASRRFTVGEVAFIVSPNGDTVITCYHTSARPQQRRRAGRRARRDAAEAH